MGQFRRNRPVLQEVGTVMENPSQATFVDQLLGQVKPPSIRDAFGRRAKVLFEKPTKMAGPNAESRCELLSVSLIKSSLTDQPERSIDGRRCSLPSRSFGRSFGSAPQAGTKTGISGCRCARKKYAILDLGRPRRTDGSAIDSCAEDSREKPTVKSSVACQQGSITIVGVKFHVLVIPTR